MPHLTDPPIPPEVATVAQEDEVRAGEFIAGNVVLDDRVSRLVGFWAFNLVDAFARHRLSASRQSEAGVREVVIAALQPIADRVFNDNGDKTVNTAAFSYEEIMAAYWAHRRLTDALPAPQPRDDDAGLRAAAQALCNFAWTALTADCEESRAYLNSLVNNLREALATPPARQDGPGVSDEELLAAVMQARGWGNVAPANLHQYTLRLDDVLRAIARARSTPTPDSRELERLREALARFDDPKRLDGQEDDTEDAFKVVRAVRQFLAPVPQDGGDDG